MFDATTVLAIVGTFLIAGTVKGVIGLGLPTVSLGLLTAALDLTTAMALLIVPSFVTNFWQAVTGGNGRAILLRVWPFLLMATASVWLGATALTRLDLSLLSGLLGGLLVAYSTLNLAGVRLAISAQREVWAGPLFGTVNGILTGMTGSFVVPGVMFLQAIGLSRDMLVQAMGILFTASTVALALALQGNSILTNQLSLVSAAAVIPAAVGMVTGQRIRRRLSENRFRQAFFIAILVLGAYIIANATLGVR
ncbi:MAG: sulfite exporter TauE/SafE family protein [Gammaproteobacteria bacterium]|nr:sulfite exporter TauE/SafE family protein [Gammaproteobacteria bacterium]